MTDIPLEKIVADTIAWANELSEAWVGTTMGRVIDKQREHVEDLMKTDPNLAQVAVFELAQTCDYAEKETNG